MIIVLHTTSYNINPHKFVPMTSAGCQKKDAFQKLQVQHESSDRLQGSKALARDLWAQLQQLHIKGAQGLDTTQELSLNRTGLRWCGRSHVYLMLCKVTYWAWDCLWWLQKIIALNCTCKHKSISAQFSTHEYWGTWEWEIWLSTLHYSLFSLTPCLAKANRPPGLQPCMILRLEIRCISICHTFHVGPISSSKRPKITPVMLRLPRYWKLCEGQVPRSKAGPNLSAEGDLVQDVINHPSKSLAIEDEHEITEWDHNALVKLRKCFPRLEGGPLWLSK